MSKPPALGFEAVLRLARGKELDICLWPSHDFGNLVLSLGIEVFGDGIAQVIGVAASFLGVTIELDSNV